MFFDGVAITNFCEEIIDFFAPEDVAHVWRCSRVIPRLKMKSLVILTCVLSPENVTKAFVF